MGGASLGSLLSAPLVATALALGCIAAPGRGGLLLCGTAFATLTAAELKELLRQPRPKADGSHGMPSTHAVASGFAASGWALELARPPEAVLLAAAALIVAELRVLGGHHSRAQAHAGLVLGFLLACAQSVVGPMIWLAGLGMRNGQAALVARAFAAAESLFLRAMRSLPCYLLGVYASLLAATALAATGFAAGIFRFEFYPSSFRIEAGAFAELPHRLAILEHATVATPWPPGCGGHGGLLALGGATSLMGNSVPVHFDVAATMLPDSEPSTDGPPLLVFFEDTASGDVLAPEAIASIDSLLRHIVPTITAGPLRASSPLGATGSAFLSPSLFFTSPEGRMPRHVRFECNATRCVTAEPLPGGNRLQVDAASLAALERNTSVDAQNNPLGRGDGALSAWARMHCQAWERGMECGPLSCCPCDAPPVVGCAPLPLCREEGNELLYVDIWSDPRSSTTGPVHSWNAGFGADGLVERTDGLRPADMPPIAIARSTIDAQGAAGFERRRRDFLQCSRQAELLMKALVASGEGDANGTAGQATGTRIGGEPSLTPSLMLAVAPLRFSCDIETAQAGQCDGTAYASAVKPSGIVDYEVLLQQARIHSEYTRVARIILNHVDTFNAEQAQLGSSLRASAWGGAAFIGMEEERGLYQLAQMVLLSGIATVTAVTLLLGSIRLAVLLLILPVLAFPLAWLLFAAVFGQRTLGITQTAGLLVVVSMGVEDALIIAGAARDRERTRRSPRHIAMAGALRTSALAVVIASLTDAMAFSCNWATPIVAVREFGLFVGMLVLVNLTLVILAFPALYILFAPSAAPTCSPFKRALHGATIVTHDEDLTNLKGPSSGHDALASADAEGPFHSLDQAVRSNLSSSNISHDPPSTWPFSVHRHPIPVLFITALVALCSCASLRYLRADTIDYRWAAFPDGTNMHRLSVPYQRLVTTAGAPPGSLGSAADSALLNHPVWPAKAPLRLVWGSLGAGTVAVGATAVTSERHESDRPLSEYDAASLQLELVHVCEAGSTLPGVTNSACLGGHFAQFRRALNLSFPVPSMEELSSALCQFGSLTFSRERCSNLCAQDDRLCIAFRETAPRWHPSSGWHDYLRWRRHGTGLTCGELELIIAEFELGARAHDASGASLRPYYDAFTAMLRYGPGNPFRQAAVVVHEQLAQMRMEETIFLSAGLSSLVAFLASCGAIYLALQNILIAALVVLHVALILLVSLGAMAWMGWGLGPSEAMMFTVSTGMSIDFVLHIAIAYQRAPLSLGSCRRTSIALSELGRSLAQAALTTCIAASFMTHLPHRPLSRFGLYIIVNQLTALAVAMGPFAATLAWLGDGSGPCLAPSNPAYHLARHDAATGPEDGARLKDGLELASGEGDGTLIPKRRLSMQALERFPVHMAFILDGNGRWAKQRGLPRSDGHKAGYRASLDLIAHWFEFADASDAVHPSIPLTNEYPAERTLAEGANAPPSRYLTLYCFSTENWARPKDEVDGIIHLIDNLREDCGDILRARRVRLCILGNRRDALSEEVLAFVDELEAGSSGQYTFNICFSYGARNEITAAVRSIAHEVELGRTSSSDISEDVVNRHLWTAGQPDPELLIRTSGEQRISNFLLYQLAYTELIFCPILWPDFGREALLDCLEEYAKRDRRLGGLSRR